MKNVFVCQTVKHFYFAVHACMYFSNGRFQKYKHINSVIYLCVDHQNIEEALVNQKNLCDLGIRIVFINESSLIEDFSRGSLLSFSKLANRNFSLGFQGGQLISSYLKKKFCDRVDLEDNIFLFHDKTLLSKFFLSFPKVHLIEDGLANYSKIRYNAKFFRRIYRMMQGLDPDFYILGESKRIKQIFLFKDCPVPEEIKTKVKFIKQADFFASTDNNKHNSLFMFNLSKKNLNFSDYDVILLTQGLDSAGLCTHEDKLAIYSDIVEFLYKRGLSTLVKTHPSEHEGCYDDLKSSYGIDVMSEKIPIEALAQGVVGDVISLRTSAENFDGLVVLNLIKSQEEWRRFDLKALRREAVRNLVKYYDS